MPKKPGALCGCSTSSMKISFIRLTAGAGRAYGANIFFDLNVIRRRFRSEGHLVGFRLPRLRSQPHFACATRADTRYPTPRPSSCKTCTTRPRPTAGTDRPRGADTSCAAQTGPRDSNAPRPRAAAIIPARRRPGEPASNQSFARPQLFEPTAPSAPVNPSGFASGVLRFAPALRVTGAEPVEGGPD